MDTVTFLRKVVKMTHETGRILYRTIDASGLVYSAASETWIKQQDKTSA